MPIASDGISYQRLHSHLAHAAAGKNFDPANFDAELDDVGRVLEDILRLLKSSNQAPALDLPLAQMQQIAAQEIDRQAAKFAPREIVTRIEQKLAANQAPQLTRADVARMIADADHTGGLPIMPAASNDNVDKAVSAAIGPVLHRLSRLEMARPQAATEPATGGLNATDVRNMVEEALAPVREALKAAQGGVGLAKIDAMIREAIAPLASKADLAGLAPTPQPETLAEAVLRTRQRLIAYDGLQGLSDLRSLDDAVQAAISQDADAVRRLSQQAQAAGLGLQSIIDEAEGRVNAQKEIDARIEAIRRMAERTGDVAGAIAQLDQL